MNTLLKPTLIAAVLALTLPLSHSAIAADKPAAAAAELTDAEVRKVDLDAGRLTLKHAEIKNLDMPGMTMVFAVKDKAMLDKLKAGDRIRFKAAFEGGKYTVTEIQAPK